jgi:hypothetical protein
MNEKTSNVPIGMDRKDLAIGRIVRLLPLLSVKELDAMGDRLGQTLRPVLHQFEATGTAAIPPRQHLSPKSRATADLAEATVDLA